MKTEQKNKFSLKLRPSYEKWMDKGFKNITTVMAATVAAVLITILVVVFFESREAINQYGINFIVTSDWDPINNKYGAFTAIYGTIVSSLAALIIAIPLGLGTAIFITEDFFPEKIRFVIGLMVELLAAIPSVVLGLWAIFVMEPFIRPFFNILHNYFGWLPLFSSEAVGPGLAPAIIILSIMILPIITSIARDSIEQVPSKLKEAAYGIGATRWCAIIYITIPAAISGITGGILLALGRAMGETMAVTMIIGNSNQFSLSLFSPGYTISSLLANQFGEADSIQVSSLMYAALILMIMTLIVNVMAQWLVKKLSLKY